MKAIRMPFFALALCVGQLHAQVSAITRTIPWGPDTADLGDRWQIDRGDTVLTVTTEIRVDTVRPPLIIPKPPAPIGKGIPFAAYASPDVTADPPFTATMRPYTPGTIIRNIALARASGTQLVMAMTGGNHDNNFKNGRWDFGTWAARMDKYRTPAIQAAIAKGVADGTIVGNSVMDEPQNQTKGKAHGPPGYMTKARVDSMCGYVKKWFPSLPTGVVHDVNQFEPAKDYQVCDFVLSQYREAKGPVKDFVAANAAFGKRSHVSIINSLNVMHGGKQVPGCVQYNEEANDKLCPTTPAENVAFGLPLGAAGCAFTLWEYEEDYFSRTDVLASFKTIADALGKLPRKPCRRTA